MKYHKKALIDAEQFDGSDEMAEKYPMRKFTEAFGHPWVINGVEANYVVHVGDWIVTDSHGYYWPIADDVFKRTYEPVTETKEQQECPYCQKPFKILLDEPGILEYITQSDKEFYLTTEVGNIGFTNFRLSYCTCCGRKLEVEK